MMKHSHLVTYAAFTLATVLGPGACKPKSKTEPSAAPETVTEEEPRLPPPPEIAEGRSQYLRGFYGESAAALQPVFDDLRQREQERASGFAAAWLALALSRDVVENAEAPVTYAMEMAKKLDAPDLAAIAKMAHGVYRLGLDDLPTAVGSLEAAIAGLVPPTADTALAHILLGEALIGRAFGGAESSEIKNPQDLVAAKENYGKAARIAQGLPDQAILLGRAEEGLAAIAKYTGKTDAICGHTLAALEHYENAGAAEFLREGPRILGQEAKCEGMETP